MRLREPLFFSFAVVLALVTPVVLVTPASAATPPAPTIVSVVPSKATVLTGATLTIKVTAENESKKVASAVHDLTFLLSKSKSSSGARKVGEGSIPSLPKKTRKSFTFDVAIPSNADTGSLRLLLCHPRPGKSLLCHDDNVKLTVKPSPAKLTLTPSSHDFGNVVEGGASRAKQFTVRNVGRLASGTVAVGFTGAQASSFAIESMTCGATLAPNATCTVDVTFNPGGLGSVEAGLKVTPSATGATGATASLNGKGATAAQFDLDINAVHFGNVQTGTTSTKTVVVTNNGGVASGAVTFSVDGERYALDDPATTCTAAPLAPGASCALGIKFSPVADGFHSGVLSVYATPGAESGVFANFEGTAFTPANLVPSSVANFGTVGTGTESAPKTVTFTNNGGQTTGTIAISMSGAASQFSRSDDTCTGATLAAGASCTVKVRFAPTALGDQIAAVRAEASPGGAAETNVAGTGATPAAFSLDPGSLDFGSIPIGSSLVKSATLKNTGGVPTGALDIYFNGNDDFALDGATTTCTSAPLAAGASCTLAVKFTPSSDWTTGGIMNVLAEPPGFSGLAQLYVSGKGVPPPI